MKVYLLPLLFLLLVGTTKIEAQQLVSATLRGSASKQQIAAMFSNNPFIRYGAKYYKVTYTSKDAKGQLDTLSGLLVVPDDLKFSYPKLVYQHGTSDCKKCVPSSYGVSGGEEGQLGLLFGGLGYVSLLPDFVGMGEGRGFQTYVHDATTVSATEDMLAACDAWTEQNGVFTNDQLFITGYSQGGYASMSFHKYMQETYSASSVTAAAHLSGPYSLSGVMRDLILGNTAYNYPAYVPNTVLGFNEVYGIYNDLSDFFKPEYVADIKKYYEEKISLVNLNSKLVQLLVANTGASVGGRLIREDVLIEIKNNPNHIINQILRENDVYDWKPESPTAIFYCKADDQVPYLNSIVARDTMLANGTTNLTVTDVKSDANHIYCATPALTQTLLFFFTLQKITSSSEDVTQNNTINIYPNPTSDIIYVSTTNFDGASIFISDIAGRKLIAQTTISTNTSIDISGLQPGIYHLSLNYKNGNIQTQKLIVQR
jgi:hypothetical protein